ncbi:Gfo/Idh/MocA family protein [Arthrobacter sp. UYCu723]
MAAGEIGRLEHLSIIGRDPAPYIAASGGIFRDMTIHDLDMARFFTPDIMEVTAHGANAFSDYIADAGDFDSAVVTLRGRNGDPLSTQRSDPLSQTRALPLLKDVSVGYSTNSQVTPTNAICRSTGIPNTWNRRKPRRDGSLTCGRRELREAPHTKREETPVGNPMRWRPTLNTFAITFGDRFPAAEKLLKETAGYTLYEMVPRSTVVARRSDRPQVCSSAGRLMMGS